MGLFDRFKRIKDPVRGTAQVVSATGPPDSATSGNCRMHLAVTVPGFQSFAVEDSYIVKVRKWPSPGQQLPIDASQSNPREFKILWDEVPNWDDVAAQQVEQVVQQLNQQPPGPAVAGWSASTVSAVSVDGRPATPEEIQQFEATTGLDLDGDGRIAGGAAAPPGGGIQGLVAGAMAAAGPWPAPGTDLPGAADDRVAALERLAALKASGALTEAEFEAEKARILRSP